MPNVISIKLQSNFIEITHRHGCYPVNLLHTFRTPFTETPLDGWFYQGEISQIKKSFLLTMKKKGSIELLENIYFMHHEHH